MQQQLTTQPVPQELLELLSCLDAPHPHAAVAQATCVWISTAHELQKATSEPSAEKHTQLICDFFWVHVSYEWIRCLDKPVTATALPTPLH